MRSSNIQERSRTKDHPNVGSQTSASSRSAASTRESTGLRPTSKATNILAVNIESIRDLEGYMNPGDSTFKKGQNIFSKENIRELARFSIDCSVVSICLAFCVLKIFPLDNIPLVFSALVFLVIMEALHYPVLAVERFDMSKYQDDFPRAVKCHQLVDSTEKVKRFVAGRQIFVIIILLPGFIQ